MASSHIRSAAAKKSRVVPARCTYACTCWFLHLAATVEALWARAHFLRVFPGSLTNPPNRQKLWATPSRRFQQELHFTPTVIAEIMWGTLNGAISGILGAGHGMAERDAAGCPSKSVACPRAWVLNSVAKFVYCVQTVCKARFRSFHIVCRCVIASLDSRVFWLLSLSTLIAALWFCLLCPTIGK